MYNKFNYLLCMLLIVICCSWGFYAHKKINHAAVFTLPTQLAAFYKKHIDVITEKAVDADKRCYVDSLESPRHFIDVEEYEDGYVDAIPIHWSQAVEKFQERKLHANGIVPWQIYFTYQKLVKAFREKNTDAIIRHSADLGHYVSDAHVPLHTTRNYNGQLTGQIGIHAFWESRLPEMFADDYNLFVGKARYLDSPLDSAWAIIRESNALVDSVLLFEKELSNTFPKHLQRSYITRNNILISTYSDAYANAYHQRMQGMVEDRMRKSIQRTGSFWFSAWVDAGQPSLKGKFKADQNEGTSDIQQGEIIGREEWH
ncbi:zinc dependent phospholipase C family protein [Sphingobacterium corticibacterium]|uniref:zinc dependent phospholipase C family protein n=1 Tax=Sphingobacterium corticibacterium TaxID=2484746 RepID=UPI0019D276CD|nr:zinc dependent phospholipase C family protein [Sphingobacterium corticibacterium]